MLEPIATGLTVADFERLGEDPDMVKRELIDGELYVTPRPVWRHQSVASRIARRLLEYTEVHGSEACTEPGLRSSERDEVSPDVVLVSADALARMDPKRVDVTPALVVEVSSPSTRSFDLVRKRALYERDQIPEFWFVDLDADVVQVYRLGPSGRYDITLTLAKGDEIRPPALARPRRRCRRHTSVSPDRRNQSLPSMLMAC
ncbi:MAG: Uma2 family endonuclease [Egibacteraceae bacterium]